MLSRFPSPLVFPAAPAPRLSRCFQTTADGRIPLSAGFSTIWETLQPLGVIALQTRHYYARLIAHERLPAGKLEPTEIELNQGRLSLSLDDTTRAWARIELCPCCHSPGKIELTNTEGVPFLEACLPRSVPAHAWANHVATLVRGARVDPSPPQPGGYRMKLASTAADTPTAPASHLPLLVRSIVDEGYPIAVNLGSADASHTRVFRPTRVENDGCTFLFSDGQVTLQTIIPTKSALRREPDWPGGWIHLTDNNGTIICSLGPACGEGPARAVWDRVSATIF